MTKTLALLTVGLSLTLLGCAEDGSNNYEVREEIQAGGRRSTVVYREREQTPQQQQAEKPYALKGQQEQTRTENVWAGPHNQGVTTFRERE